MGLFPRHDFYTRMKFPLTSGMEALLSRARLATSGCDGAEVGVAKDDVFRGVNGINVVESS